jgi:hypothetical protein
MWFFLSWLLFLTVMFLRFICIITYIRTPFLFMAKYDMEYFVYLLMGIWVVSTFGLLCIMQGYKNSYT